MNSSAEQELEQLRSRLREIRTARKWLQEFRLNNPSASISQSRGLARYTNYLNEQETKTIELGNRIKAQLKLSR